MDEARIFRHAFVPEIDVAVVGQQQRVGLTMMTYSTSPARYPIVLSSAPAPVQAPSPRAKRFRRSAVPSSPGAKPANPEQPRTSAGSASSGRQPDRPLHMRRGVGEARGSDRLRGNGRQRQDLRGSLSFNVKAAPSASGSPRRLQRADSSPCPNRPRSHRRRRRSRMVSSRLPRPGRGQS